MRGLTKNRTQLLRLFYTNPEQSFYMQEMGRVLGKKPGVFQRTLNNMEKEKILISEYKANVRYFRVNKEYPLYKEIKSIVFKTVGVIGSIQDVLEKAGGVHLSFLYGSYAKAKENYLSDIDIIVIGTPDEDRLIRELDKLETVLRREINYKLYSPERFKKDARLREPFLLRVLEEKKIMIKGTDDDLRKVIKK